MYWIIDHELWWSPSKSTKPPLQICFFSLKLWTPMSKIHFSIYRPLKIGLQALKIGARMHQKVSPVCQNRGPIGLIRGPIFYESNCSSDSFQLQIGSRMLHFGARWYFSWTIEFFPFFAFSSQNYNDFDKQMHKKWLKFFPHRKLFHEN